MNQDQLNNIYQTLQGIQTNVNQLYQDKGLVYDAKTKTAKPIKPPTTQPKISAPDLSTAPITIPEPPQGSAQSNLGLTLSAYGGLFGQPQTGTPTAQGQGADRASVLNRMYEIIGLQSTQGEKTAQLQKEQNIEEKQKQLTELENRYLSTQRSYENSIRDLEVKSGGYTSARNQELSRLSRDGNRELADIAIQRSMAINDVNTANAIVEQRIKAEFEPMKNELDGLRNIYGLMQNDLTDSERLIASANINLQADRIKTLENTKTAIAQSLVENGRPDLIAKLDSATTPSEMLLIAGSYGVPVSTKLENQIKTLQLQKAAKDLADVQTGQNIDVDSAVTYAKEFAETGKIPSLEILKSVGVTPGQLAELAKQTPYSSGTLLSSATGMKQKSLSPSQEDGVLALYDISQKVAQLKELDQARIKGVIPAGFGKVFGSEAQGAYVALRKEIVDLLARARTGAALTAQEEEFYQSQLPGRVGNVFFGLFGRDSQKVIEEFENKINGTLQTKLNGNNVVINGYSTVNVGGIPRKVGEILDIGGIKLRVLADGTLTDNI